MGVVLLRSWAQQWTCSATIISLTLPRKWLLSGMFSYCSECGAVFTSYRQSLAQACLGFAYDYGPGGSVLWWWLFGYSHVKNEPWVLGSVKELWWQVIVSPDLWRLLKTLRVIIASTALSTISFVCIIVDGWASMPRQKFCFLVSCVTEFERWIANAGCISSWVSSICKNCWVCRAVADLGDFFYCCGTMRRMLELTRDWNSRISTWLRDSDRKMRNIQYRRGHSKIFDKENVRKR